MEEEDVWYLDAARLTKNLSDKLERNFYKRCPPSWRPSHLGSTDQEHSLRTSGSTLQPKVVLEGKNEVAGMAKECVSSKRRAGRLVSSLNPWSRRGQDIKVSEGRLDYEVDEHGKTRYYDSSLAIALLQTTWRPLLIATAFKASRAILDTTSSLVTKQLIAYITESHAWGNASEDARVTGGIAAPRAISHGIGLAVGLALMQEVASLCGNHYYLQSYACGELPSNCLPCCFVAYPSPQAS